MPTPNLPKWLQKFLEHNAVKIELLVLFVAFTCLMFYYFTGSSRLPILLSLNFAAILYFTFALMSIEGSVVTKTAYHILNMGSSVATLGSLFKIYNYPGFEKLLQIGMASMVLALVVFLISNKREWTLWRGVIIIRIILIATLVVWLWFN